MQMTLLAVVLPRSGMGTRFLAARESSAVSTRISGVLSAASRNRIVGIMRLLPVLDRACGRLPAGRVTLAVADFLYAEQEPSLRDP